MTLVSLVCCLMPSTHGHAQTTYVETVAVMVRALPGERQFSGDVVARQQVDVSSDVDGQVSGVLVEPGDLVKAGQSLVELRDEPAKWRLASAEAALERAEAEVRLRRLEQQRLSKLLESRAISQNTYDQTIAQLQQARADVAAQESMVALLSDEISRHQISAPFDGVVTARMVEVGKWVAEGDAVVNLASNQQLRVELALPQGYFPFLSQQTGVDIRADWDEQWVPSYIERIVPFADASRTFQVWVALEDVSGTWLPGMSATAVLRWEEAQGEYPYILPADTLLRTADGSVLVWKITRDADGVETVISVQVEEGYRSGELVAVFSDQLAEGDQIVIKGNENLRPQQQVISQQAARQWQ